MLNTFMLIVFGFLALLIVLFVGLGAISVLSGLGSSLFRKLPYFLRDFLFGPAPETPSQIRGPHVDDSADPYRRGTFIRH